MPTDEKATLTGSCMCGGVRYQITGSLREVVNCHCEPCRQFTGHHMAATAVSAKNISFEKEEEIVLKYSTLVFENENYYLMITEDSWIDS